MIALRPAVVTDYDAYLPLFAELQVPEPPPSREAFGERFLANMTVATADDQVVGFIRWRAYGDLAHVINVVTHAAWRGRRIGQQLLDAARTEARAAGCTHWYLNVKQGNASAIALYHRYGFSTESESVALRMSGAAMRALPATPEVSVTVASDADDAAISSRFQIPLARVVHMRTRSQLFVARVPPERAPRGCASFFAGMPGVAPLCAADLGTAGALLQTCLAAGADDRESLIIVVEGHTALATELRSWGATLEFELFTMTART